jgi:hypothetical protein
MGSKHAFTIEQLQEFQRLSKRLKQVEGWKQEMAEQMAKLERQQRHADEEAAEIEKRLSGEFAGLAEVGELFSTSAVPDTALTLEETGYVTKSKKRILFKKILADYSRANPVAETISYTEVKKTLAETYKIKTRSIANFFLGILSDYQTVGGNRNKAIVIPKDY